MKTYNSNYLGLVINNNDPEYRGRVQIFIPHIMPTLYEGWNKQGSDISISCVGDNIENSLSSDIVDRLVKILPWAEAASPIIGSSSPGGVVRSLGEAVQSFAQGVKRFFNQSPTSQPASGPANTYISNTPWSAGFISSIVGANDPNFPRAGRHVDYATAVRNGQAPGWQALNPATTQPQPGDIVVANRDKNNLSYNSKWDGPSHGDVVTSTSGGQLRLIGGNVSDTVGAKTIPASSSSQRFFTILRPPPEQAAKIVQTAEQEYSKWSSNNWTETSPEALNTIGGYYQAGKLPIPAGANPEQISASTLPPLDYPLKKPEGFATNELPPATTSETNINFTSLDTNQLKKSLSLSSDQQAKVATEAYGAAYLNLKQRGIDDNQAKILAAGIVGNIKQETNFDPNLTHDNNTGYGLLGWASRSNDDRLNNLVQFAQARGESQGISYEGKVNPQNILKTGGISTKTQIDFLFAEFDGAKGFYNQADSNNARFWKDFTSATSPSQAALVLSNKVVRPSAKFAKNEVRQQTANEAAVALGGLDPNTIDFTTTANGLNVTGTSNVIANTDGYGRTIVKNSNDMAKGMFAFPNVGAMVWVFFREGNPLFPVYFAASYGSSEWQSAYRGASLNATGTNTGNPSSNEIANSAQMNFNSAGGLEASEVINVADPSKTKKMLMIHGPDGSNKVFTPGYVQDYTKGSKRDQIDSNSFKFVGGSEEKWIEASSNENCRGHKTRFVGVFTKQATEAARSLADISYEINKKLTS